MEHIRTIVCPSKDSPSDYYNKTGFYSVIMQALVGFRGLFMDTYIGWLGKIHDARVFSNSSKCHKGREGTLFPGWNREIHRVQVHTCKIYNYILVQTCNFIQVHLLIFIDPVIVAMVDEALCSNTKDSRHAEALQLPPEQG